MTQADRTMTFRRCDKYYLRDERAIMTDVRCLTRCGAPPSID